MLRVEDFLYRVESDRMLRLIGEGSRFNGFSVTLLEVSEDQ